MRCESCAAAKGWTSSVSQPASVCESESSHLFCTSHHTSLHTSIRSRHTHEPADKHSEIHTRTYATLFSPEVYQHRAAPVAPECRTPFPQPLLGCRPLFSVGRGRRCPRTRQTQMSIPRPFFPSPIGQWSGIPSSSATGQALQVSTCEAEAHRGPAKTHDFCQTSHSSALPRPRRR